MLASPTQAQVMTALRSFLDVVLPPQWEVVLAQPNRVPESKSPSFVVMSPLRRQRLSTNLDAPVDCKFTGSIAGQTMTVSAVAIGALAVGAAVFGAAAGTVVLSQISGAPGGAGTYGVSGQQTLASGTLAAGLTGISFQERFDVQLDFHSADSTAADAAAAVSAALRDEFGYDQFAGQTPDVGVRPAHADDPRQAPFVNAEQQYEWRWTVECSLLASPAIAVPQQFADELKVALVDVDATYPPH